MKTERESFAVKRSLRILSKRVVVLGILATIFSGVVMLKKVAEENVSYGGYFWQSKFAEVSLQSELAK